MNYYITKSTRGDLHAIVERVVEALKQKRFGILTDVDIAKTFKAKFGADFPRYRILGACNPNFAHQALTLENKWRRSIRARPCNRWEIRRSTP